MGRGHLRQSHRRRLPRQHQDGRQVRAQSLLGMGMGHSRRDRRNLPALLQPRQPAQDRPHLADLSRGPARPELFRARGSTTPRACCSPTSRFPTPRSTRSSTTTTSSTSPIIGGELSFNSNVMVFSNQDGVEFQPPDRGSQVAAPDDRRHRSGLHALCAASRRRLRGRRRRSWAERFRGLCQR